MKDARRFLRPPTWLRRAAVRRTATAQFLDDLGLRDLAADTRRNDLRMRVRRARFRIRHHLTPPSTDFLETFEQLMRTYSPNEVEAARRREQARPWWQRLSRYNRAMAAAMDKHLAAQEAEIDRLVSMIREGFPVGGDDDAA
ncbi:hypothetical protein ACFPN7_15970 [Amycolatopsis halotolerans]|uniref:hypothetical protein n=1 Tax=Amycolatopsis halotolerans TaxID=330083 RepID=UPI00361EC5E1